MEAFYIPAALQPIYNQKDVTLGEVADLFVTNFIIAACSSNHKDFNLKSSFAYYKYTITQESESLSISTWY